MIRVLICDDQALVRGGLRMMVDAQDHVQVVGEAANGREALQLAAERRPDVVLMDIRMPVLDGIEATEQLAGQGGADARVLMLTTFDEDEYVYAALRAGASGFMLKSAPPADLIRAIEIIHEGHALLAPGLTRRLIGDYLRRPIPPASGFPELTHRETEILQQIAVGRSNNETAETFVISPATVKSLVDNVFAKLDVRDRVQAVILAYERGLTVPRHGGNQTS